MSMSPGDQVMEGKSATLTCESDANPPVSHYTWFDWNNQSLPYHSQKLRLEPVKVQHSGAYWCQGTNSVGKGHSPLSTLTVYCKASSCSCSSWWWSVLLPSFLPSSLFLFLLLFFPSSSSSSFFFFFLFFCFLPLLLLFLLLLLPSSSSYRDKVLLCHPGWSAVA